MNARILFVEDDESLSFVTRDNLELRGYEVVCCYDGEQALDRIQKEAFDLYILDVMLPQTDGFQVAETIRRTDQQTPILFLTARSMKEDRLHGLRIGGDDYITKPFSIEELVLKVEIFLKRRRISEDQQTSNPKPALGSFTFHYANLELQHPTESRQLTQREADLLNFLIRHKNKVIRRSRILKEIWGKDDYFLGRSLDVFISRLRKYLRADPALKIENIHGVGFKFICPED